MPFLQLTFDLGSADPAPFEQAVFAAGALSVTLSDAANDPVLEPAPGTTPLWPTVRLQALFDADADPQHIEALLGSALASRCVPVLRFTRLEDRVWEREWLRDFRPMRFGSRLWVCPGGMRPPQADAVTIDLDPGLAFGTGTHPTTALCLEWLDSAHLANAQVIDYGCGSGILAIAALKLGAGRVLAVDIDPQAVAATRENALRNAVAERITVARAGMRAPWSADVLLANILAGPLVELAPLLADCVRSGGNLVLSGILSEQSGELAEAYSPWFHMTSPAIRDGWARLTGRRRRR